MWTGEIAQQLKSRLTTTRKNKVSLFLWVWKFYTSNSQSLNRLPRTHSVSVSSALLHRDSYHAIPNSLCNPVVRPGEPQLTVCLQAALLFQAKKQFRPPGAPPQTDLRENASLGQTALASTSGIQGVFSNPDEGAEKFSSKFITRIIFWPMKPGR